MPWRAMEERWQEAWRQDHTFEADPDGRPKKTITVAYPYPNSPQHLGHGRTYTISDINARFWRMRGHNVLFPMGFHYTGTPILGMAKRVRAQDPDILDVLRNVYGVPQDVVERFDDPLNIADYFRDEIRCGMKEMGYSVDWRREFTTIDAAYRKFVEWQVESLREAGLIMQGTHPVGWCPEDQNPVSQHDTLGDVEPDFTEYTLVKFRWNEYVLPAATLRPETVFGVTNMWVNPGVDYEVVSVDGSRWIVSEECATKLEFLGVLIKRTGQTISGRDIVGGTADTPLGGSVPVLPAAFVDPDTGTGLVMSVPAHAPFDYVALKDLGGDMRPIPVISVPGYGDCPAAEACISTGITGQDDPRLEDITAELYGKEFYDGVLLEACGGFAGRKVSEAKDDIREWMMREHGSETFLEMSGEVRCRCGAKCVVKVLSNQWFLDYGREGWKDDTRECLRGMTVLPPEIRGEFHNVVEWLRERACARQQGMGTKLPWDSNWIVESLSDSTIYMAMYVVIKFVRNGTITPDIMDRSFFDYVFLGKGTEPAIPGIRDIREEFLYYYPVDYRHSGRDLVPNHLTFFVMNHVALFPRELWPRGMVVNGSVLMNGKKMSKSMGNIIPLRDAIKRYGADPIRLGMVISAELLQDADINLESVEGIGTRLERMLRECRGAQSGDAGGHSLEDRWIASRMREVVRRVTDNVEKMRMREALQDILYGVESDMLWYKRWLSAKGRDMPPGVHSDICRKRALLLAPFAPHVAEEMWRAVGEEGLISRAEWPGDARDGGDSEALHWEHLLRGILEDITRIVKVSGVRPRHIRVYVAEYREVYVAVLRCVEAGHANMRDVMGDLAGNPGTAHLRRFPDNIMKCLKDILGEPEMVRRARMTLDDMEERRVLEEELEWVVRTEFDAMVTVSGESDGEDPGGKAKSARPYKPAIYIE